MSALEPVVVIRRLLRIMQTMIEREITATFGVAWRGSRFQWPYLQNGHGYELLLSGQHDIVIASGTRANHYSVVFDTHRPYSAVPRVWGFVQVDQTNGHPEDYHVYALNITALGFDLYVVHQPVSSATLAVGGGSTTQTALAGSSIANNPAWSAVAGANGSGGAGSTGDEGAPHTHLISGSTGGESGGHTHSIPAGTDAGGGTSGAVSANHTHGEGGTTSSETGTHTHGVGDAQHNHTMVNVNHQHGLTLDTLTVNITPNETGDTTITTAWFALGLQTPPS